MYVTGLTRAPPGRTYVYEFISNFIAIGGQESDIRGPRSVPHVRRAD